MDKEIGLESKGLEPPFSDVGNDNQLPGWPGFDKTIEPKSFRLKDHAACYVESIFTTWFKWMGVSVIAETKPERFTLGFGIGFTIFKNIG